MAYDMKADKSRGMLVEQKTVKSTTRGQTLYFRKRRQRKQSLWTELFPEIATYCRKKDLGREIKRIWKSRSQVVPVVVGTLGTVSKKLAGRGQIRN